MRIRKLSMIPLNVLAIFLCWIILTFFDVLSPQFQIRPVAELSSKIKRMESNSVLLACMEDDWVYQGEDYMLWDHLTFFLHPDSEEGEAK